ncbi:unnamed protein product [Ectocarpus sp. 6 AP-2014]
MVLCRTFYVYKHPSCHFLPKKEQSRRVCDDKARCEARREAGFIAVSTLFTGREDGDAGFRVVFCLLSLRVLRAMRSGSVVFWAPASHWAGALNGRAVAINERSAKL